MRIEPLRHINYKSEKSTKSEYVSAIVRLRGGFGGSPPREKKRILSSISSHFRLTVATNFQSDRS